MGRTACIEPQCLYKGALYLTVELYLYSPYGPYGLYRASVPLQGVHFTFFLTSNLEVRGNYFTGGGSETDVRIIHALLN
jgi:hypothetical protein